jgi:hypothetical protein
MDEAYINIAMIVLGGRSTSPTPEGRTLPQALGRG